MTIELNIHQGSRAREVLENEVYQKAFADYKQEITKLWETSPNRDAEGRERLWLMLVTLNKVQSMLESTMESGKLAMKELEYQKSLKQRAQEFLGMTP